MYVICLAPKPKIFFTGFRPSFLSNCIIPDKYLLSTSEHCVYTLEYSVNTCQNMITLTHWPLRDMKVILQTYFQTNLTNWYLEHSMWNWVPQEPRRWYATLVKAMAWCRQTASHCLFQRWSITVSPFDAIMPQWDKTMLTVACRC